MQYYYEEVIICSKIIKNKYSDRKFLELRLYTEEYAELCQTSKVELFEKKINWWKPLTIFAKMSILYLWQGSENGSAICYWNIRLEVVELTNITSKISVTALSSHQTKLCTFIYKSMSKKENKRKYQKVEN